MESHENDSRNPDRTAWQSTARRGIQNQRASLFPEDAARIFIKKYMGENMLSDSTTGTDSNIYAPIVKYITDLCKKPK